MKAKFSFQPKPESSGVFRLQDGCYDLTLNEALTLKEGEEVEKETKDRKEDEKEED